MNTVLYNYAGQAVGLAHEVPPAAELVQRLVDEAAALLARCASLGAGPDLGQRAAS